MVSKNKNEFLSSK